MGLERDANRSQSIALADAQDGRGDRRMQMEMLVGIDVIKLEARGARRLRIALRSRLPIAGEHAAERTSRIPRAPCSCGKYHRIDQSADIRCGGSVGLPSTSTRCSPTRSLGIAFARVTASRRCRRRDHQAGSRQNPFAMGQLDRVVDFAGGAEIVRGDDQALQKLETIMSSRVRRNWKNSTPSRKRRTIISRDVSISPTISAIFEGRK